MARATMNLAIGNFLFTVSGMKIALWLRRQMVFLVVVLILLVSGKVNASTTVEIVQIVGLQLTEDGQSLEVVSFGSGTAIASDIILTNKHVVKIDDRVVDMVLICLEARTSKKITICQTPASVIAVNSTFDAALLRPWSGDVFLPFVKLLSGDRQIGDSVVIHGFPAPLDNNQKFGGEMLRTNLREFAKGKNQQLLQGDKQTITRGRITGSGYLRSTGGNYWTTNAKVNFGSSGGAAFDIYGNFIGVPTFKDQYNRAIILKISQLSQWVARADKFPLRVNEHVQNIYQSVFDLTQKTNNNAHKIGSTNSLSAAKKQLISRYQKNARYRYHLQNYWRK